MYGLVSFILLSATCIVKHTAVVVTGMSLSICLSGLIRKFQFQCLSAIYSINCMLYIVCSIVVCIIYTVLGCIHLQYSGC